MKNVRSPWFRVARFAGVGGSGRRPNLSPAPSQNPPLRSLPKPVPQRSTPSAQGDTPVSVRRQLPKHLADHAFRIKPSNKLQSLMCMVLLLNDRLTLAQNSFGRRFVPGTSRSGGRTVERRDRCLSEFGGSKRVREKVAGPFAGCSLPKRPGI